MQRRTKKNIEADMERAEFYLSHGVWSVDRIAGELGYKLSNFNARFTSCVGMPPTTYRAKNSYHSFLPRKIVKAKRYLRCTELPIKEVALKSGFADGSGFSGYFRSMVSVSPKEYRQQSRENGKVVYMIGPKGHS